MCNCLTIKILFNITEVAPLWIVDEGVNVLCPILWNSVGENTACLWRSFSCLSALTSNLTATPPNPPAMHQCVKCRRTLWCCSLASYIWNVCPPSLVFSTGPLPCKLWLLSRGWTSSGSDDRCQGKTAQWFAPIRRDIDI